MKSHSQKFVFASLIALAASGCLRGETKTLSEIQQLSKDRFTQASRENLPAEVSASLGTLTEKLGTLGATEVTTTDTLTTIESELSKLLPLAGYPVRPAFTEVRNEFLEANASTLSKAQAKLLAFRAYNVLGEELLQGRFEIYKKS